MCITKMLMLSVHFVHITSWFTGLHKIYLNYPLSYFYITMFLKRQNYLQKESIAKFHRDSIHAKVRYPDFVWLLVSMLNVNCNYTLAVVYVRKNLIARAIHIYVSKLCSAVSWYSCYIQKAEVVFAAVCYI